MIKPEYKENSFNQIIPTIEYFLSGKSKNKRLNNKLLDKNKVHYTKSKRDLCKYTFDRSRRDWVCKISTYPNVVLVSGERNVRVRKYISTLTESDVELFGESFISKEEYENELFLMELAR
jgi:hypothetical protein